MGKVTQELKYKRLKVGHACYICRSKKIKCDGLRPCMQCKARGRICQPSKLESQNDTSSENNTVNHSQDEVDSSQSNVDSDDDSILFSRIKQSSNMDTTSISTYSDTWTANAVQYVSEDSIKNNNQFLYGEYSAFGSFVRWREEPPLPHKYSSSVEMPSNEIQMHLIDLFFQTRYNFIPIVPKQLFYKQLQTKGPLITPLLLNAIYCVVSRFSTRKDVPKSSTFFNRAKRLIDDFLDVPRMSTVVALCLLSLYEPIPIASKSTVDQHCRSWIYSGMAFRMCLELGLNMDTPHSRGCLSEDSIELRRRIFWTCYCLDKFQSVEWERLWSIPSSLAKTALPKVLPDDDDEERWILCAFQQKIKLCLIAEEGLQIRASFSLRNDFHNEQFYEKVDQYRLKILHWRDSLSPQTIWNLKQSKTVKDVMNEHQNSPVFYYVRMLYYFMLTDVLFYLPTTEQNANDHRMYATQLTKHIEFFCDNPSMIVRYELIAHAIIAALRIHIRYLDDKNHQIAQQSSHLFNRCIGIIQKLQNFAIIPKSSPVLQNLSTIWQSSRKMNHPNTVTIEVASDSTTTHPQLFHTHHFNHTSHESDQQLKTNVNEHQMQQSQYEQQLKLDPSRTTTTNRIDHFNFQTSDNISLSSSYNNMTHSSSNSHIHFTDQEQFWENSIQDDYQKNHNDDDSIPILSEDTISHSMKTLDVESPEWLSPKTTECTWSNSIASQQQQQQPQIVSYEHSNPNPLQQS
ncbi:fungal-specific transcription factor domain-containing protein [Cokeromyces recurvatus]|uniref:fungal-specific transcription factor domain-containing protein n=1 Tax=Cokeromyces recurvatus TaxID=90255 RepID=UPI002220EE40|nr:fungal-specific transcription factor domain-containing protein [Cokeromyces recurvatus]KAI7905966.1 fungal-specific transcription factor domain-containing protein [Cokeromyces recurvatus]